MFDRVLADWSVDDLSALTDLLDRFNDDFLAARPALLDAMAPAAADPQTQTLEHSAS
jgi:hypothetical protein